MSNKSENEVTGVRAKLAAHKKNASAPEAATTTFLPKSGVKVSIPGFINHGKWMTAQRLAGSDTAKAQVAFVAEAVKFEGEKLNVTELTELCDAKDILFLIGELFGDDDKEQNSGNGETIQ